MAKNERHEIEHKVARGQQFVVKGERLVSSVAEIPQDDKELGTLKPARDERGQLTRDAMVATINAGGSVIHGGELITNVDDLPTEAELAKGDAEREKQVAAALDDQIAKLQQQKSSLKHSAPEKKEK
jgi:hypothetical protein